MPSPSPYYIDSTVTLWHGDALEVLRTMPDGSVHCVVTSPPYYGLRDYGVPRQYGLESSPDAYVETMRAVFAEAGRVLVNDGALWLNLGDSYSGAGTFGRNDADRNIGGGGNRLGTGNPGPQGRSSRGPLSAKNLLGIPWRVAFALQADGWYLRNAVVWHKPNAMPESVTDRLACRYEFVFLLTRSERYWFDLDPIREPLSRPEALDEGIVFGGRNGGQGKVGGSARRGGGHTSVYGGHDPMAVPPGATQPRNGGPGPHHRSRHKRGRNPGDVWSIATQPFPSTHFAVMAADVARQCILAGCRPGGVVLDPFCGSGTTGMVAQQLGRRFVGIDLNASYLDLALRTRLAQGALIEEVT